jgi:serine/threonine protein kinase
VKGTVEYLAPEVVAVSYMNGYSGSMSDVWSCGVILYLMLCVTTSCSVLLVSCSALLITAIVGAAVGSSGLIAWECHRHCQLPFSKLRLQQVLSQIQVLHNEQIISDSLCLTN